MINVTVQKPRFKDGETWKSIGNILDDNMSEIINRGENRTWIRVPPANETAISSDQLKKNLSSISSGPLICDAINTGEFTASVSCEPMITDKFDELQAKVEEIYKFYKKLEKNEKSKSESTINKDIYKIKKDDERNISMGEAMIKNIETFGNDKVVKVTFNDDTFEKMTLQEPDTFDMRECLFIALAKHHYKRFYKKTYTYDYIEVLVKEHKCSKKYTKEVEKGLKLWNKILDEKAKEVEREEMIKHKREKRAAYKARRDAKRELERKELAAKEKEEKIEIIAEAIRRSGLSSLSGSMEMSMDDGK